MWFRTVAPVGGDLDDIGSGGSSVALEVAGENVTCLVGFVLRGSTYDVDDNEDNGDELSVSLSMENG